MQYFTSIAHGEKHRKINYVGCHKHFEPLGVDIIMRVVGGGVVEKTKHIYVYMYGLIRCQL